METQEKSHEIGTTEMRQREAEEYLEAKGLHLVKRSEALVKKTEPPMPRIDFGWSPDSPWAQFQATWTLVLRAMVTRWYYAEHPIEKWPKTY